MASGVQVPLTFEIYKIDPAKGDQLIDTKTVTQEVAVKIGKLTSSHLRIDDESVSRMHAVIEIVGPDELYIIDLGSTKGTIVNGQKVNKCRLQSGDTIVLGSTKLVVTIGEAIASASDDGPTQVQAPPQPQPAAGRSTIMGMAVPTQPAAFPPAPAPAPPPVSPKAPAAAPTMMGEAPKVPPPSVPSPFGAPAPSGFGAPAPAPASFGAPPPPRAPQATAPAGGFPQQGAFAGASPAGFGPPPGYDPSAVEVQDGSRAIEVAAMFEDAVVDVHHFTNPASGEVTGATKGMLGGGALSLFAAFVTFVIAYAQAAKMAAAWEAWDKLGKPHNEFLATLPNGGREGPALDILISLFLIFGLFALVYGLLRLFDERQPRDFTIGPDANALFKAPGDRLPVQSFPLVHSTGTDYELLFTKDMSGDVTIENQTMSLADLAGSGRAHPSAIGGAYAYAIPNGARIKIDMDQNTYLVSSVAPPRHYPAPLQVNWGQQAYTGGVALAVALFLGMIFSIPPDPKSLSLDAFMNDQRFAKFLIKPPEEKEEQIPEWLKKKGPDEAGGKGKRHKGEEGKMGKKTSKNKAGLYGLKGPKDNPDPHLAKMLAEENAAKAGVLGILKAQEGSHLASIFGRDSALGNDAENVLGGLVGTQIGEAYGVGGLGLVGSGKGGGGTGEGTIGLGNLGTIGKGGGGGSGSGYGRGAGGLGGRHAHAPDVVPGTAQVRGSLDKEIIRRIIRRHLNEVKFCYERELMHKPDLYGRVMINFTIAGTGQVVASVVQNSTMNNMQVEQCIAGAVRRWEFPKPQGGGIVMVSYPFVLKAAGAE